MECKSLLHAVAWEASQQIVEVFAPLLSEEERREAFIEVLQRVKIALEIYHIKSDRMASRLRPGKN